MISILKIRRQLVDDDWKVTKKKIPTNYKSIVIDLDYVLNNVCFDKPEQGPFVVMVMIATVTTVTTTTMMIAALSFVAWMVDLTTHMLFVQSSTAAAERRQTGTSSSSKTQTS